MAMHDNGRVPSIRVGDVERDTAAAELGEHYAAGRLTIDELHERLGLVLSARTRADLTHVLADLPTIHRPARPPAPDSPPGSREEQHEPADYAGRLAAVALLLVAILIWLFTVAMFTRHGYYYRYPQGGYFPAHNPPPTRWFTP